MTTPAGWYDDPQDARFIRYWDGLQWCADVAPKVAYPARGQAASGPDLGPSNPMHYIVPIGRSWQSVLQAAVHACSSTPQQHSAAHAWRSCGHSTAAHSLGGCCTTSAMHTLRCAAAAAQSQQLSAA